MSRRVPCQLGVCTKSGRVPQALINSEGTGQLLPLAPGQVVRDEEDIDQSEAWDSERRRENLKASVLQYSAIWKCGGRKLLSGGKYVY